MKLLLTLIFVVQSLLINSAQAQVTCGENCSSTQEKSAMCLRKAQEKLVLDCDMPAVKYVRTNDNQIIISFGLFFSDNDNYSVVEERKNELTINKLRLIDQGTNSFRGDDYLDASNPNSCNFSIYLYDEINENGYIKLDNSLYLLDKSNVDTNITFEVQSFNENYNITYKYEALPFDYLLVDDNKLINQSSCDNNKNVSWLNCLTTDFKLNPVKCQNTYRYKLSYGFTDKENVYTSNLPDCFIPKILAYNINLNINYPPQMSKKDEKVLLSSLKETVDLECSVECANPGVLTYKWFLNDTNGNPLIAIQSADLVNKFKYDADFTSENQSIIIICAVSNGVNVADYAEDSQTKFVLNYNKSAIPNKGSKSSDGLSWWIIVSIVCFGVLIVIVYVAVHLFLTLRHSSNSKNSKSNKSKNSGEENENSNYKMSDISKEDQINENIEHRDVKSPKKTDLRFQNDQQHRKSIVKNNDETTRRKSKNEVINSNRKQSNFKKEESDTDDVRSDASGDFYNTDNENQEHNFKNKKTELAKHRKSIATNNNEETPRRKSTHDAIRSSRKQSTAKRDDSDADSDDGSIRQL